MNGLISSSGNAFRIAFRAWRADEWGVAFFPCKNFSTCEDPAERNAVQNFSAELPDRISFFGRYQCDPVGNNPLFRTAVSPRSQLEADLLAASCLHEAIITNDEQSCSGCGVTVTQLAGTILGVSKAGANATAHALACLGINTACFASNTPQSCTADCPGGPNTYTVPAGTFTAPTLAAANLLAANAACANAAICGGVSNTAQSCTVFCPQTNADITATVAAGIFFGLSQADADAAALAIACALAFIVCQAMPPLVGNQPHTCSQECNGVTVTYTVPAGAFVSYDQASANLIAFTFCFQVLSQACQEDDLPPAEANVGSEPQTCSIACDGGGTFSQTIQAGAFRLENRAAANAAALSYCQAHVTTNRFCLSALAGGVCVNQVYAEAVSTTGPGTPTFMGVTSGQLPPGLSLSGGLLAGIPNTPGTFAFTITAASAFGFASRDYTITVAEIQTVVLPDGSTSAPYAQAIVVDGFTNPTFTIVGGALPTPWALHPSTGIISGNAADTAGEYSFVVEVTDGVATCTQDYTVTVTGVSSPQLYWTLEGPAPAANHDEYTAALLTYNSFGGVPATVAGKVNLGLEITGGFCTVQQQGPTLAYAGPLGWSIAFWIQWDGVGPVGVVYQWDLSGAGQSVTWDAGSGAWQFAVQGVGVSGNVAPISSGVWHLIVFSYTHGGAYSYSLNGGALAALGVPPAAIPIAEPLAYAVFGSEGYLVDEVAIFPEPLDAADIAYLFNGGAGRTWPITLPP